MDHQDVDDDEDGDEEKDVEQLRHQSHQDNQGERCLRPVSTASVTAT